MSRDSPWLVAVRHMLQSRHQPSSVRVVADDLLACVASGHDMVDGPREFDAKSSWHEQSLRCRRLDPQARTENKI
jgi:hypothetical protein